MTTQQIERPLLPGENQWGWANFGSKQGNDYAALLGDIYNEIPKAVLAAIAVSALTCATVS
jgi:hypothetical protein